MILTELLAGKWVHHNMPVGSVRTAIPHLDPGRILRPATLFNGSTGVHPMRKLLLSLACTAFMAGLVLAAEYTVVSYDKDKKVVTLKEGDKEVTGKLTDKTKVVRIDKDGNKTEGKLEGIEKMLSSDKAKGRKLEAKIEDGVITEITTKGKK
jgi:hypothetical protein